MFCNHLSSFTGFCVWGYFFHLRNEKFLVFQTRKIFKKGLNNQRKIYNFLKFSKEILRLFEIFFYILSNVLRKLGKVLENFRNMDLPGIGGGAPRS